MFDNLNIFLATRSPRRIQLLQEAGMKFTLIDNDVEEIFDPNMSPELVPAFLAKQKAIAGADFLKQPNDVLIAADCIVVLDDQIIGKPSDYQDAVNILKKLSGRTHLVISGVHLLMKQTERSLTDISEVTFSKLFGDEIDYYLANYKPFDKAGAYGIQDWLGLCKVEKIKGSQANIMGLPMNKLYACLRQMQKDLIIL